jgi:hypothetical protein
MMCGGTWCMVNTHGVRRTLLRLAPQHALSLRAARCGEHVADGAGGGEQQRRAAGVHFRRQRRVGREC